MWNFEPTVFLAVVLSPQNPLVCKDQSLGASNALGPLEPNCRASSHLRSPKNAEKYACHSKISKETEQNICTKLDAKNLEIGRNGG